MNGYWEHCNQDFTTKNDLTNGKLKYTKIKYLLLKSKLNLSSISYENGHGHGEWDGKLVMNQELSDTGHGYYKYKEMKNVTPQWGTLEVRSEKIE